MTHNKLHKLFNSSLINILLLFSMPIMAHTGIGEPFGFFTGFTHPLSGMDHILAMIAVGFLAAQMGGTALWIMPTTFVSVMALAGILGSLQIFVPFIETGILASVLILGIMIAASIRFSISVSMLIIGFFAIFHGFAHGMEMPIDSHAAAYGAGFALSTAMLHGIGIILQKLQLTTSISYILASYLVLCTL